jgi:hypothetical protein
LGLRGIGVLKDERKALRLLLETRMLPFRLLRGARSSKLRKDGWLRCVRQAVGMPVDEVARRLGVCRWEVHRLEESERNSRIMLATLSNAAKGLGCELIYALVPLEKTLQEMAEAQQEVRESKRGQRALKRAQKRAQNREEFLESIGWEDTFLRAMRTVLRRNGIRVRPRKTERGAEEQLETFKEKMKLAALARQVWPE